MDHLYLVLDQCNTKRTAIKWVREEADFLIAQAERQAEGFDRGLYRDDDCVRAMTITQARIWSSEIAFALSRKFSGK